MTIAIEQKWEELRRKGLDLGPAVGVEQDAGYEGRIQVYQRGRIYWHKAHGAHEVHGGILQKYLAEGGPGVHPQTGERRYGFPLEDESRTPDDRYPIGRFEFGEIDFVRGTGGGVGIYGAFYQEWTQQDKEVGCLGHPLIEPTPVAGGEAAVFTDGILWRGPSTDNHFIIGSFAIPRIGRPDIIDVEARGGVRFFGVVKWTLPTSTLKRIEQLRPDLFSQLAALLYLKEVTAGPNDGPEIPLYVQAIRYSAQSATATTVNADLTILPGPVAVRDRCLYDLTVHLPDGSSYAIGPHAFYARKSWDSFGIAHVTDTHVAKRIEVMARKLAQAREDPLSTGGQNFVNFNDAFRDFIRYCNHLHDLGLLDVIIATGDLVDYASDGGPGPVAGNYGFFEDLVRGKVESATGVTSEELTVPIFTNFGNHDYRLHPYRLFCTLSALAGTYEKTLPNYEPFNLTEQEAIALQGDNPTVGGDEALDMARIDHFNQQRCYDYFLRRVGSLHSYVVALGKHRIVMLDTGWDLGLPASAGIGEQLDWFIKMKITGNVGEDKKAAFSGTPRLRGVSQDDIDLVGSALIAAGTDGLVLIGMHAPPLHIANSEFSGYLRETQHPTADRREIVAFLLRHISLGDLAEISAICFGPLHPSAFMKLKSIAWGGHENDLSAEDWDRIEGALVDRLGLGHWLLPNTRALKVGGVADFLDEGTAQGLMPEFLKRCVARENHRAVDLILCGHVHRRVEWRLKWVTGVGIPKIYHDFYFENPDVYYPTRLLNHSDPVHVRVVQGSAPNQAPTQVADLSTNPATSRLELSVPPYATPLNESGNPASWWDAHRPVVATTAALGPLENYQRPAPGRQSYPSFAGFRVMTVIKNRIARVRYVTLSELRRNSFIMPWESTQFPEIPLHDVTDIPRANA